jgi:mono/diheme cytochrome c family protein
MRSLAAAAVIALLAAGCSTSSEANLFGRDLFVHSCAVCHSSDGSGGIGPNIGSGSNVALNLSDEQIAGVIRVGPGRMPSFSRLTPDQVESLVEYVRSLSD